MRINVACPRRMLATALEQLRRAVAAAGTGAAGAGGAGAGGGTAGPAALDPTRSGVRGADQSWVRL